MIFKVLSNHLILKLLLIAIDYYSDDGTIFFFLFAIAIAD